MAVKTTERSGTLYVEATGDFSLEEAQRTFLEVLDSIKQHTALKVLFDGRAVVGEPAIIDRFYYGEFAANSVRSLKDRGWHGKKFPQFAYVMNEPLLDPLRLGETVALNRGMNVKAFENYYEAVKWLDLDLTLEQDEPDEPA